MKLIKCDNYPPQNLSYKTFTICSGCQWEILTHTFKSLIQHSRNKNRVGSRGTNGGKNPFFLVYNQLLSPSFTCFFYLSITTK